MAFHGLYHAHRGGSSIWITQATHKQLENEYATALQEYLKLVQDGCALLSKFREMPVSKNEREEIFEHRRKEAWAHTAYTRARTKLWKFLNDSKEH
jgi:hypothetical protein